MMIDKTYLTEMTERLALAESVTIPADRAIELVELCKFGLWAREVGIGALKFTQNSLFRIGILPTELSVLAKCENALAALPKEGG